MLIIIRIQVVLAEYGVTGAAVAEACRELNIPLAVHFHGYDAHRKSVVDRHQGYGDLFRIAGAIIAVSGFMKNELVKLGADPDKITVNPCGPESGFGPAPVEEDSRFFLSVGRFVDKKSPFLTILAFEKVYREFPDISLKMCGDGPLLESCRMLVRALKMENAVEFLGVQPHDRIRQLMMEARGFLQHSVRPSHGDAEGTPVAVLEASLAGLPVIATRHAGITDVIIHQKTGFLVDEFDIGGMSEYIRLVLMDVHKAREVGREARKFIQLNYSMEKSISRLDSVVQNLVAES